MAAKKTTSTQEQIEKYEALVKGLEGFARQKPASYRFRVGALAGLGYAYVLLMLAIALAIAGGIGYAMLTGRVNYGTIKLELAALVITYMILRALWVRMPPPDEGIALSRENAPRLFAMLDDLTTKLQAPKFHHVLLTSDFNAGVMQAPRLGILGWQRNFLMLGLPLMEALTPDQFRAVLAHEIGHLSGNHSRFAGWIYRVRQTWSRLLEGLDESGGWFTKIFTGFFDWYAPFFNAYSFALARADEYEADRCAAQYAGAKNAAEALISIKVAGRLLSEKYWPSIYDQADKQPTPTASPLSGIAPLLREGAQTGDAMTWLDEAIREKTSYSDTHPSLTDRLAAIGYLAKGRVKDAHPSLTDRLSAMGYESGETVSGEASVPLPPPPAETAAERYFGPTREAFTAQLDREWQQNIALVWKARYEYAQETQKKLAELEAKAAAQPLSEEEALQQAQWVEEFRGSDAAIPLYEAMLAQKPDDPYANFALGRLRLEKNDESGIALIEKTMAQEPASVFTGCQIIYGYLMGQKCEEEAETYRRRYLGHVDQTQAAAEERATFRDTDNYAPHGLPESEVSALVAQLAPNPKIKEAILVRKVVTLFAEKPCFLLGIAEGYAWYQYRSDDETAKLIAQVANTLDFPHDIRVLALNKRKKLAKKIRALPGAVLYRA